MHYVYWLIDYKGFPFYIGYTKNLEIRLREHTMHKNATPAKTYRVRRSIAAYGKLKHECKKFETKAEALIFEAEMIRQYRYQLVNKTHGKNKNESTQRRSKGRSKQCPYCLNWYKRIGSHKCKIPA